jgi:hypothetical protein
MSRDAGITLGGCRTAGLYAAATPGLASRAAANRFVIACARKADVEAIGCATAATKTNAQRI